MSILYYYDYRLISLPSSKIHFVSTSLLFFYYIMLSKKIFHYIIKNNENQEEIIREGCMERFKKSNELLHSILNCTLKLLLFYLSTKKCSAISILQCFRGNTLYQISLLVIIVFNKFEFFLNVFSLNSWRYNNTQFLYNFGPFNPCLIPDLDRFIKVNLMYLVLILKLTIIIRYYKIIKKNFKYTKYKKYKF